MGILGRWNFKLKFKIAVAVASFFVGIILLAGTAAGQTPKYVFLFIGDGLGFSQRQLAEYYAQERGRDKSARLLMNAFPVAGVTTTHSLDTLVTDSAAAGTALATGFKTNNDLISQLPSGKKLKTVTQAAIEKGWATGIITTTRLTHATPAVFVTHNKHRDNENEIAVDYVASGVHFFAGGGFRHFVKKGGAMRSRRDDDKDVIEALKSREYRVFVGENQASAFRAYKPRAGERVFAALTESHMPYEIDRVHAGRRMPSLEEMTQKGLESLFLTGKSFFVMIEGGRIDHACHANDALTAIHDTLAMDQAVAAAYRFYRKHPEETLIVVVADHETGGLGLGLGEQYFLKLRELAKISTSIETVMRDFGGSGGAGGAGGGEVGVGSGGSGGLPMLFEFVKKQFSLRALSESEKQVLEAARDIQLRGASPYARFATQVGIGRVISARAGVDWTSTAHTAVPTPVTAIGARADRFGGYMDNTDIPRILSNIMDLSIHPKRREAARTVSF